MPGRERIHYVLLSLIPLAPDVPTIGLRGVESPSVLVLDSKCVRISAYTNQSKVSHSVRMMENCAEVYSKQPSLERSFELLKEL